MLPCLEWRKATAEDQPFIFDLTYKTMRDYLTASHPLTEEQLTAWLKSRNEQMHWFIAFLEGIPVGALAFSRNPDRINIDSIHVLPDRQNQGLGTAMLLKVQQWADEQKLPIVLQVMKNNTAARRFYERHGFTVFGEDQRDHHLWHPFSPAVESPVTAVCKSQTTEPTGTERKVHLTEWLRRLFFRSKP